MSIGMKVLKMFCALYVGVCAARSLMHGIVNNMCCLIHGFPVVVLDPGRAVKVYISVPVELYTVGLRPCRTVKCISLSL